MSKSMVGAAGGISAEDRAKLIPENIREGVILFNGTPREVTGSCPKAVLAFVWYGIWDMQGLTRTYVVPSNTDLCDYYKKDGIKGGTITFKKKANLKCIDVPQTYAGYCRIDGVDVVKDGVYSVSAGSTMVWTSNAGGAYFGTFEYA